MLNQIKIVLVDDHQTVRESWKFLLEEDSRFIVVGQCENGAEAIETASQLLPDIMLMDVNMSPVNGFEATEHISLHSPEVKIIGLSANNHPGYANKMMNIGARGYVTKNSSFHELTAAIMEVYNGGSYLCEEIRQDVP